MVGLSFLGYGTQTVLAETPVEATTSPATDLVSSNETTAESEEPAVPEESVAPVSNGVATPEETAFDTGVSSATALSPDVALRNAPEA